MSSILGLRKRSRSQASMSDEDAASLRRQRKEDKSIRRYSGESSNTQVTASDFETGDSCVLRDFPKHKSSHLQFLSWVAYTRQYSSLSITEEERRTCPLLWCREEFLDQESMLRHVWNCEQLAKGLYWCFQCQRPETVGKTQCRRCHGSHSKTDRIATVAKKMFSALGSNKRERCHSPVPSKPRNLSKIAEAADESPCMVSLETTEWNSNEKRDMNCRQQEDSPPLTELPNTVLYEMEGAPPVSEMHADWQFSQELPNSEACQPRQEKVPASMEAIMYSSPWNFLSPAHSSHQISPRPSRSALPRINTSMVDLAKTTQEVVVDWIENPMSATIVSPLSPTGGLGCGTLGPLDALNSPILSPTEISPTDSEASGKSLFTDSGHSSATFESSWNGSDINLDFLQPPSTTKGKSKEIWPSSFHFLESDSGFSAPPLNSGHNDLLVFGAITSTSHTSSSCATTKDTMVLSPHWSDAKSLVRSFHEVLTEHLQHSRNSLQRMAPNSITRELLSLSLSTIVSIGFGVFEGLLQGRYPNAVMPMFSFTHIAYALAIVIDNDQSKVQTDEWFQDLLALLDHLSSDKQRQVYTQIVRVIWQPRDAAVVMDAVPHAGSSATKHNRLLVAAKDFLDIQESLVYREKIAAIQNAIPHFNYMQASFESTVTARVIDELINNNTTVAFLQDVATVVSRLHQGLIMELRQLELELICAGRLASQSESLYDLFKSHVTSLCDGLYSENPSIKSRDQHHLEAIAYAQQLLPQDEDIEEEEDRLFEFARAQELPNDEGYGTLDQDEVAQPNNSMFPDTDMTMHDNEDFEQLFATHSDPTTPFVETKFKQPRSNQSLSQPQQSQNFTSNNSSPPELPVTAASESKSQPGASYGAQTPTTESKYRCQCGYEPTGEERWKPSNLARHKRIQHATTKYTCGFRGCKSTFTRSDNLRSHQREKGHLLALGIGGKSPDGHDGPRGRKKRRIDRSAPGGGAIS